jgi:hypothetical protein
MKKLESLGRVLGLNERKAIIGGPGGGTCCAQIACYQGSNVLGYVCEWSNQPGLWVPECLFQGFHQTDSAANAGCGICSDVFCYP